MMNPEIKQKWVEALRSGKYEQGNECLRKGDKFCCLGVFCEVVAPGLYHNRSATIPNPIANQFGIEAAPSVRYKGGTRSLWALNDEEGLTFNERADIIEEQL